MSNLKQSVLAALAIVGIGLAAAALVVGIFALTGDDDAPAAVEPAAPAATPAATPVPTPSPAAAPSQADAASYTVWLVEQAIAYYESEGREATIARYSSPDVVDGQWYVFITDDDDDATFIGHYNPEIVGQSLLGPIGTDITGFEFGKLMVDAGEEGRWVTYVFYNPEAEGPQRKHAWVVRHDGLLFGSGWYDFASFQVENAPVTKTDPSAFAQWFVQQALDRFDSEGLDATLDFYNSRESVDGDWYVFILEEREDGGLYNVAHATRPELLGTTRARIDRRGVDFGAAFKATTEEGHWVDYVILNPATCDEALKHSWSVRRGNLIFGAGWYEDRVAEHPLLPNKCEPAAYTVAHVDAAIARYQAEGREAAIAWHSDAANNDGRWYTFIIDPAAGRLVAHPAESFTAYDAINGEAAYDDGGWYYTGDLLLATADGVFVRDTLVVPGEGEINPFFSGEEVKHYYAVRHDGLIFGSGWYGPAPTADDISDYTRLLVARALTMYDDAGIEAVLDHHNAPESADGERYVFVLEDREDGLYTVAHPVIPNLVGTTRARIDARGFDYGAAFIATTRAGRWIAYVFPNPETGQEELKHTWVVRRGDYLIGSGWYEPIPTQDDPEGYTRLLVSDALGLYTQSGLEAVLDRYNSPASADGPWYVFVLELRPDGIYTLAHPTRPERVGETHVRIDARGIDYGREFARTPRAGHWVDYIFFNPETGEEELKHTWVVRRGDYLFGSGWYEAVE